MQWTRPTRFVVGALSLTLAATAISATPARGPSPGESALERLSLFARSKKAQEDRNADGKPDLWRTFYPSGKLSTLTTSSRKDGKPDLRFHYSETGAVTLREYADPSTGEFSTRVRTIREGGRDVERVESPGLILSTKRSPRGYYVRRAEFDLNRDGKTDRVSSVILRPSSWAQVLPPGGPCPPTGAPVEANSSQFDAILRQIGDQIEVDASCEGYRPGETETTLTREQLKLQTAAALQGGLECLRNRGAAGERLANELLSQVFATPERKLTLRCNPPELRARCPGEVGDTCGRASRFDEPSFPGISLGSCRGGAQELSATIFHEALHLAGSDGHQHVHNYSDVEATEHVEPCSQCCQARPASTPRETDLRSHYCALCDNTPANDPTAHTLKYGSLLMLERNSELALMELRKVVAARPNNYEAWLHFLNASLYEFQARPPNRDSLFQLRMALREVERLRAHPEQRDTLPVQLPTNLPDDRTAGLLVTISNSLIEQHLLEGSPPLGVSQMDPQIRAPYLAFRDHQAQANLVMRVCSSMSELTTATSDPREQRARSCFQQGRDLGALLSQDVDALDAAVKAYRAPANDSDEPARLSISARSLACLRDYATQYQAGVQCVSRGTPIEECAGARAAPRPSDAPSCPTSVSSPTPAACGPSHPLF